MAMTTVPCVRVLVNISSGPVEWQQSLLTQSLFLPALVPLSDISAAQRGVVKVGQKIDREITTILFVFRST